MTSPKEGTTLTRNGGNLIAPRYVALASAMIDSRPGRKLFENLSKWTWILDSEHLWSSRAFIRTNNEVLFDE